MKKALFLLITIITCLSLSAKMKAVVDIRPYFTFDNTPSGIDEAGWKSTSGLQNSSWWETRQDYWADAFDKPTFLNVGFELDTEKVDMVVLVDFMQDIFVQVRDRNKLYTNIPFVNNGNIDLTFPRVGYLDYTSSEGLIYLSLGRRQIKWGPGKYGMAISDSQPYLDNLYGCVNTDITDSWKFGYDFVALSFKHYLDVGEEAEGAPQTTFAHRFSFSTDSFRMSFTEMNNIYGKVPSLLDCTPIALWHNNFQDDCSNVMVDMTLEGRIGPVRLFGSLAMDDFALPNELNTNPSAFGASAGIEWNAVSGEAFEGKDFSNSRYAIKDETFHVNGGLNLSYEFFYCGPYMYNRDVSAGKFTSDFQVNSNVGPKKFYDDDAFFLGFKYGPSTILHLFGASYENSKLKVDFSASLLQRGSYYIDSPYDDENKQKYDAYKLPGDVTTVLGFNLSAQYFPKNGLGIEASVCYTRDMTHGAGAFKVYAGVNLALCEIDWRK